MTAKWMTMVAAIACALALASCADERGAISRVQTNVVAKDVFQGSWYITSTVIDVDYEASSLGTYEGDSADDWSLTNNPWNQRAINYNIARIRWVIDEHYLYAYRDYELVEMGNEETDPADPDFDPTKLGEPLAVYAIESHFDLQRAYNPTTGEEQNVVTENATDKRWYERQYMRVDWSKNLSTSYLFGTRELYELFGYFRREPAGFQLDPGSNFPESWKPQFRRMSCQGWDDQSETCEQQDRDLAGDYSKDELYYMSFVNQEIFTPGDVPDPFGRGMVPWCMSVYGDAPQCTSNVVTTRYAFLKRSPTRQYDPLDYPDETHHGYFAYFRNERPVFDQSSDPGDPQREVTDAFNTTINRHNMWKQWFDADGNRLPFTEREVRPIIYYTTSDMPYHQIKSSFVIASDWNTIFMEMVRRLRGQDLPPDGNGDGKPDYDPWNPTEQGSYDCHIVNLAPDGSQTDARTADPSDDVYAQRETDKDPVHDSDFEAWRYTKMVGSECVVMARVNSCVRDGTNPVGCEERGDSRYKFISYVQQPGTPFLGVATMRGDPLTGEIITGDANIGGPALDGYRTLALQYIDIASGDMSAEEYLTGENVRDYFENLGRVERPAMPITDFQVAASKGQDAFAGFPGLENERIRNIFREAADRTAPLRSRDRLPLPGQEMRRRFFESPEGQRLNRALTDNQETLAMAGVTAYPSGATLTDDAIDDFSPIMNDVAVLDQRQRERQLQYSLRTMEFAPTGYDWSVLRFVDNHRGWPRAKMVIELSRQLFIGTESHELGHCLGMRHQFGASSDWRNYDDRYYDIADANPWPDPLDYDNDRDGALSSAEERDYDDAYAGVKEARDTAGIAQFTASSTMEYTADWYEDESAMGKFDRAAMMFGYGEMAEVYENADGAAPDEIDPRTPRDVWRYFGGGEPCQTDQECPFNSAGSRGSELIPGQVEQTCIPNPVHPEQGSVCANFWDQMAAENAAGNIDTVAVHYNSCEDLVSSTNSEPGCMPFDRGATFQEIVTNFRERYDRDYLRMNFRRYRRNFSIGAYYDRLWSRNLGLLRGIYGNLWKRYAYDPNFLQDDGPFGFIDQYAASVDIMNFFAQVAAQPDIGSYKWNENRQLYQLTNEFPGVVGSHLSLGLGLGKYPYSTYQDGLTGISKLEKIGIFYDRIWALEALLIRYWGDEFGTDVVTLTNFYDLFPNEVSQLMSGIIRDETREYAPRVYCDDLDPDSHLCDGPHIQYVDWYRGDCALGIGSGACRPDPVKVTYADMDGIDFGASYLSRVYATFFGLMEIPVWYDTSFLNQLDICIRGSGDCFEITPEMQACDLDPQSPGYDPNCESSDYVEFASDEFHRTWVALNVDVAPNSAISSQTIGFDLIREAANAAYGWRKIQRAIDSGHPEDLGFSNLEAARYERDRLQSRASDLESFMGQILEWQRTFGINYAP